MPKFKSKVSEEDAKKWKVDIDAKVEADCKKGLVPQWKLNAAMLLGQQYINYDPTRRNLVRVAPWHRQAAQIVANTLRGDVASTADTVMTAIPSLMSIPGSMKPEDRTAARVADAFIRRLSVDTKLFGLRRKERDVVSAVLAYGTAGIFVGWSEKRQEVVFRFVSPGRLIMPRYVGEDDERPWIMEDRVIDAEFAKREYGADIKTEDLMEATDNLDDALDMLTLAEMPKPKSGVRFRQYWTRKCSKWPEGVLVVQIADQVKYVGKNPTPGGELPIPILRMRGLGDGPWGVDFVRDLIPVCIAHNEILSCLVDAAKQASRIPILDPFGSMSVFTTDTFFGQRIRYDGGQEPKYMDAPRGSMVTEQTLTRLDRAREDIAARHPVSMGRAQGQLRSQPAIQQLQERDVQRFGRLMEDLREFDCNLNILGLRIAQQRYPRDKLVQVTNNAGAIAVFDFGRAKLAGVTDIRIVDERRLPTTAFGRAQHVLTMQQAGVLNPKENPKDRQLALTMFGMSKEAALEAGEAGEVARIENENSMLDQGIPVQANEHETHELHQERHKERMNAPDFEELGPQVRENYQRHLMGHEWIFALESGAIPMARARVVGGGMEDAGQAVGQYGSPRGQEPQGRTPALAGSQAAGAQA